MITSSKQVKHLKALEKRFYPRRKTNHTNCTRFTIPSSQNHKCVLTNTIIIIIIIIIIIVVVVVFIIIIIIIIIIDINIILYYLLSE